MSSKPKKTSLGYYLVALLPKQPFLKNPVVFKARKNMPFIGIRAKRKLAWAMLFVISHLS
jgi:hypothetical protein